MTDDTPPPDGFAPIYEAWLLFRERPVCDAVAFRRRLQGAANELEVTAGEGGIRVRHLHHTVTYVDGTTAAAELTVAQPPEGESCPPADEAALAQSWDWPAAAEPVSGCQHRLLVADRMAGGLPYAERAQLFRRSLKALVEAMQPLALYFPITEQYLDPAFFRASFGKAADPLCGLFNVRLVRQSGEADAWLMDSLGLAALGLSDLECLFSDRDPNEIGQMLWTAAYYLYQEGDVIEDGHTIQGAQEGERWRCHRGVSTLSPGREVIRLQPDVEAAD